LGTGATRSAHLHRGDRDHGPVAVGGRNDRCHWRAIGRGDQPLVLEEAGADTSTVEFITIGFDAVGNLIGRTVDAAFGFWSAEAVALEGEGEAPVLFRPDQYGAPPYPELVFFAATESIEEDPLLFEAFADALARGYATALSDPETAIDSLAALAPGIDTAFATAEFEKVSPHFMSPDGR